MPLEPDFLDLMTETVTIETQSSEDEYSKPTYGSPVTSRARIERRPRMTRDTAGDERVSGTTVYLYESIDLSVAIRVTLPDGSTPEVLSLEQQKDTDGLTYYTAIMLA